MKRIALAAFALVALAASATAQVIPPGTNPVPAGAAYNSTPPTCVNGSGCWLQVDVNGQLKVAGTFSATGGTVSNATSAQATSATNTGSVSYLYGFNGATWDQLQVDASKFLKVNCATGCSGGTFNNNADAVATSATNGQTAAWLYGFNGTTYDRLRVNASKELNVADATLLAAVQAAIPAGTNLIGSVMGPTADGSAAANPPVLVAGTTDGTATGLVAIPKISAGGVVSVDGSAGTAPVLIAGTARIGYTSDDPCTQKVKTNLPISQNGTSSVQLIALSGATVIYVCSLSLIAAGATTVAITTGTGSACVTGNAAVIGTTTANIANSMSLAANGGMTLGNGAGTIAQGAASSELCMINGSNVFVSGNLTYVQQ